MNNYNIATSSLYRNILSETFELNCFLHNYNKFPDVWINDIVSSIEEKSLSDDSFRTYKIYQKTQFLFVLDTIYIGIINDKYIVSYDGESSLFFRIIGDSLSNWTSEFFSLYPEKIVQFSLKCYSLFNIPIHPFEEYNDFTLNLE